MKRTFLLNMAAAILAIAGCNTPQQSELTFKTIAVEDFMKHPRATEDYHGLWYKISFTYPEGYGNKTVLDTLQRKFIGYTLGDKYVSLTPEEAVNALAADWKKEYDEEIKEESDFIPPYEYAVNDTILFVSDTLLQMWMRIYQYAGGVHGSESSSSHLFNLQTGEEYAQADIFKPEASESVRNLIISGVLEDREVKSVYEVEYGGETAWIDNLWTETTNFALTQEGVRFTYSDYEVGSYAFGRPDVTIPYAKILPCLREGTPVWNVAKAAAGEGGKSVMQSELQTETGKDLYLQIYYRLPDDLMPDGLKTEQQRRQAIDEAEDSNMLFSMNEEGNVLSWLKHLGDGQYITWEMAGYPTIDPQRVLLIVRLGDCFDGCVFPIDKTLLYHIQTGEFTEIDRPMEPPTAKELIDEKDFGSAELANRARAYYNRKPALSYRELNKDGFSVNFNAFEFWNENGDYDYYNANFVIFHYKWDGIRFVKNGVKKAREE